jgi:7-keto-8-aminopelargonate synthetase-like enzyme
VSEGIEIQMGTLGKALGACGGYICGSRLLIDYLINHARTFIFSTAPVPAAAAAATAGIRFVQSDAGNEPRNLLWSRTNELNSKLKTMRSVVGLSTNTPHLIGWGEGEASRPSAIIPLLIGDETEAVATAARLRQQGVFLPAIRYPAVARGKARLRLTITAAHTPDDIAALTDALSVVRHASRITL